jgi:hypothetical protein
MGGTEEGRGRRRRSRAQWQVVIARFAESGLGVESFCRQEDISESSFYRWRGLRADEAAGFIDAGLFKPRACGGFEIRLELGEGVVLHLSRYSNIILN